jgi:hypothetical protein
MRWLLIRMEGLVLTLHLVCEVELGDNIILPFEKLQNGVHSTLGLANIQDL